MKLLKYIVISLFLLVNLLVGSVSYGQTLRGYTFSQPRMSNNTTISLDSVRKFITERNESEVYFVNFKRFSDSMDVNLDLFTKAAARNETDSSFYYKGKIDAYYELSLYEASKYLKRKIEP